MFREEDLALLIFVSSISETVSKKWPYARFHTNHGTVISYLYILPLEPM